MQPEQKIIAEWIERTAERLGWSYKHWAEQAGLGSPTTITRAIKEDYDSVTSVATLHKLAKAAGEDSVLDFLSQTPAERGSASKGQISESNLTGLLGALLPLVPKGRTTAQSLRVLSVALKHGLDILGDEASSPDGAGLGAAARGATSRLRDLLQEQRSS